MTGHEALIAARLARLPVAGVSLAVGGRADVDQRADGLHFALGVKEGEATGLDLRGCHGLPVVIHADSYEAGFPFFDRVQDFEPSMIALCAPEVLLRYDNERGLEQWEMTTELA